MENMDVFGLLEDADDSVIDQLDALCEPLDSSADKRIFALIQKKSRRKIIINDEEYEDVVEGVDVYVKRPFKKVLAAAAVLLVVAGGTAGGMALLNSSDKVEPTASVSSGENLDNALVFSFLGGNYEKGLLFNTGGGNTIEYFLDYETLEKSPMCAMPNCTHTTSTCLAKDMGVNPVIYGDCIYYFKCSHNFKEVPEGHQFYMSSKLYRAKLDSSETELVCEFTDCVPDDWNSAFILIGNTLWFIGDDKNPRDTEYSKELHYMPSSDTPGAHFMCSIDLNTGKYTNHGQICEEYRESDYWEQGNLAALKGIYNGKLQISLEVARHRPETEHIRTVLIDDIHRVDNVADRLGHLFTVGVADIAMGENFSVRSAALDRCADDHGRVEPASVLVGAFEVEIAGVIAAARFKLCP